MSSASMLASLERNVPDTRLTGHASGGRKADTTFSTEFRGKLNAEVQSAPSISPTVIALAAVPSATPNAAGTPSAASTPSAANAPGAQSTGQNRVASMLGHQANQLQAKAMATLSSIVGKSTDTDSMGAFAMRHLNTLQSFVSGETTALPQARGIALRNPVQGIPLDPAQRQQITRGPVVSTTSGRGIALHANKAIATSASQGQRSSNAVNVGALAAVFESGPEGIAAIGYDRNGGTSYGKYQIASRPGSMAQFMDFLATEAPDLAERMAAAGPANTGSRKGAMPDVWRQIASEDPQRFEDLQENFIQESHYMPALSAVERSGYKTSKFSTAMQEVLFSTAVQHGPAGAARIFARAANEVGLNDKNQTRQEQAIIKEVYAIRSEQFGSSTPQIQAAARHRMEREKQLALNMTQKPRTAAA